MLTDQWISCMSQVLSTHDQADTAGGYQRYMVIRPRNAIHGVWKWSNDNIIECLHHGVRKSRFGSVCFLLRTKLLLLLLLLKRFCQGDLKEKLHLALTQTLRSRAQRRHLELIDTPHSISQATEQHRTAFRPYKAPLKPWISFLNHIYTGILVLSGIAYTTRCPAGLLCLTMLDYARCALMLLLRRGIFSLSSDGSRLFYSACGMIFGPSKRVFSLC